jgi:diadenosine tetraphosphate (Ap4A) HIT family hydrolase
MIFEDAVLQATLLQPGVTTGHVQITPQKAVTYVEELGKEEVNHVLTCASLVATALFETMGAHGTNIIVQEGDELRVDVYARSEDDGVGLLWDSEPGDQEELKATANKIREAFWYVGKNADDTQKKPPVSTTTATASTAKNKDDYRIKQLRRSP